MSYAKTPVTAVNVSNAVRRASVSYAKTPVTAVNVSNAVGRASVSYAGLGTAKHDRF